MDSFGLGFLRDGTAATDHGDAWGATIGPGTPFPGDRRCPSRAPETPSMGIRTPSAATPLRHHEQTGQRPILPPLEQRFGFSLGIISRGFVGSESRERFQSGMGPTHRTGMGHHQIDATPVEYGASTLATLGAEFGVSNGSRDCKRPRVSDRGPESEIFPGIREADSEPRELRWTF